jgi:hypothetical protein
MRKSGLVIVVLLIVALGFLGWVVFGTGLRADLAAGDRHAMENNMGADSSPEGLGFGVAPDLAMSRTGTLSRVSGATVVSYAPSPAFARMDIHQVPLGAILNYAVDVVRYDDSRSRSPALRSGGEQPAPLVTVTPAEGVWGMSRETMREGHIVARIQSDGDYADLGLASGLNFLWVGPSPDGDVEWVLIPGTAFAPIKDLSETEAGRIFNRHSASNAQNAAIQDF